MSLPLPLYLFLFLFIQVGLSHAADFQAKVIHITDGDTLTIMIEANKRGIVIHLGAIDCPEIAQAYGNQAKQFTWDLVHGQRVTINAYDHDGRHLFDVILEDGRRLSQELVKAGLAWWNFKISDEAQLGILEGIAKMAKVGLWNEQNPIPPWDFRKAKR